MFKLIGRRFRIISHSGFHVFFRHFLILRLIFSAFTGFFGFAIFRGNDCHLYFAITTSGVFKFLFKLIHKINLRIMLTHSLSVILRKP